jgi:septal ring factor EnvC (AmiA/AmiB activator)
MQNGQVLNLGIPSSERSESVPHTASEMTEMGGAIEQTRNDVRRTRLLLDQQFEEQQAHMRRTKVLSIVLGVLAFCLIGALWLAYLTVKRQARSTGEILALKNLTSAIGERMNAAESQLNSWKASVPQLTARMNQLQESVKSDLQSARAQTQTAITQAGQKIHQDVSQSLQSMQSRIAGVESNQREAHDTVAQLQQEVAGLRRELASVEQEATAAGARLKELQDGYQSTSTELSGVKKTVASNQTALGSITNNLNRQRMEFQVSKNKTQEIAPGILLTVRRIDVKKRQIDGLLKIAAENRSFSIHQQSIQKPLAFYLRGETRPTEFVLTQTEKQSVSGYVLVPSQTMTAAKSDPGR